MLFCKSHFIKFSKNKAIVLVFIVWFIKVKKMIRLRELPFISCMHLRKLYFFFYFSAFKPPTIIRFWLSINRWLVRAYINVSSLSSFENLNANSILIQYVCSYQYCSASVLFFIWKIDFASHKFSNKVLWKMFIKFLICIICNIFCNKCMLSISNNSFTVLIKNISLKWPNFINLLFGHIKTCLLSILLILFIWDLETLKFVA